MNCQPRRSVVVVGNGMVGSRFAADLIRHDADRRLDITVVGDEPGGAYNRVQLSGVLAGATGVEDIMLASASWYATQGVRLIAPGIVTHIDRAQRCVRLADGPLLQYDVLVLATGSEPIVPPVPGLRSADGGLVDGVVSFRTLDDCAEIERRAATASRAIVVGGGLLGLEAARGLVGRGLATTVLQRGPRVMEQQLDSGASAVLVQTLRRTGIEVLADVELAGVLGGGPVRGVALADGREVAGDLVVLCCGVRPRVDVARSAGLAVSRGVLVDDELRSVIDPDIFAIGECAEHEGTVYGLVAPGWEQSLVAAGVIAGRPVAYGGSSVVTRLKAAGVELAAMGETVGEHQLDDGSEEIMFVDGARGVYQKLVVRDGRLVGAILLGDTRTIGTVLQAYDRGSRLPRDRAALLMVRRNSPVTSTVSPTALPGAATICHCNGVTKDTICHAWQDGAESLAAISACTRATTGCGTCRDTVQGLLDWMAAADAGVRDVAGDVPVMAVPA